MLPVDLRIVRLFLHVLAATVWVGGQLTLAGLVPTLRSVAPDAPRAAARAFNRLAWPAFGVLVVTGIWNIAATDIGVRGQAGTTLVVKVVVVALSGVSAYAHTRSRGPLGLAVWGALGALSALGALFLGILLHG